MCPYMGTSIECIGNKLYIIKVYTHIARYTYSWNKLSLLYFKMIPNYLK